MILKEWMLIYKDICNDLNIDPDTDLLASFLLSRFTGKGYLKPLMTESIYVIGNAPWLDQALDAIPESAVTIVADSAIKVYFKQRGPPDYIVSDLDGDINLIEKSKEEGSKLIVHAHGDNTEKIMKYTRLLDAEVIGTTQNIPLINIPNFFGFTDGDRSAFIAHYLGARNIYLIGFDFDHPSFKEGSDLLRKQKKLKWAKYLLEILAKERNSSLGRSEIMRI